MIRYSTQYITFANLFILQNLQLQPQHGIKLIIRGSILVNYELTLVIL